MAQLLGMLEYGAINIAEIAARAGTSVGSIYQFYPNRDAILYALAEAYLADLREASAGVVNDTSLTQRQRAEQAVNWLLAYVDEHPGVLRMLGCGWVSADIERIAAELHAGMTAMIETVVESAAPDGEPAARHLAAETILAASLGVIADMARLDPKIRKAARQQLVRLITVYVDDLARGSGS
ncbi:MAG: hypothetical protein AELANPGJ_01246 [Anaerolineae bacterium]|jgi:AcrR family transcriptional regulator|nr:hypothetical protein [Anaerolineae bacterium]